MIYLLIETAGDGYDESTNWLLGAYSDYDVANAEKKALQKARVLLEKKAKDGFVDFLYDDIVWYKVIGVKVDDSNFKSVVL